MTYTQHCEIRQAIQDAMKALQISRKELAARTGYDVSTINRHISGDIEITPEALRKYSVALRSLPLRQIYAHVTGAGVAAQEYLAGVDLHPVVVQHVLVQELVEATGALQAVRLANCRGAEDLTRAVREALEHALDQCLDVHAGVEHLIISVCQEYGLDPERARLRWSQKVRSRGYVTARGSNLAAMVPADATCGAGSGGCA